MYFADAFSGAVVQSVVEVVEGLLVQFCETGVSQLFAGEEAVTPEKCSPQPSLLLLDLPLEDLLLGPP